MVDWMARRVRSRLRLCCWSVAASTTRFSLMAITVTTMTHPHMFVLLMSMLLALVCWCLGLYGAMQRSKTVIALANGSALAYGLARRQAK